MKFNKQIFVLPSKWVVNWDIKSPTLGHTVNYQKSEDSEEKCVTYILRNL